MGSGSMYDNTPTSRFEEDMRAIIDGTPWPDRPPKSKMEILLKELYDSIADWKSKTKGAYVLHGSATLQTLPSDLTVDMVGWTYDMSEEFTTDSRFVEVGKKYPAGTNVSIANVGTDESPVLKYDVMAAFVDVDAIYNSIDKVADMVADEFDSASAYSIGDIVWYEDELYTFTSAHTAGSAWSSLEVTQTTVEEVLTAAVSSINNALSDIEGMIGTEFNAANPYSKGDYVIYQGDLYKFTANHTAGAAWNSSIVTAIDLTSAIKAIEADIATLSGYFADMSDDVEALEDQVEIMQEVVTKKKTATGNPVIVEDALESNADGLVAKIVPIQDLHGQSAPYVGGAGKNLLPMTVASLKAANTYGTWNGNVYEQYNVTVTVLTDNDNNVTGIKINGNASNEVNFILSNSLASLTIGTAYVFTSGNNTGSTSTYFINIPNGGSHADTISFNYASNQTLARIIVKSGTSVSNQIFYPMIRLASVSDPTFAPYSNICPISGYDSVSVGRTGKNFVDIDNAVNFEKYSGGIRNGFEFSGCKGTYTISQSVTVSNIFYAYQTAGGTWTESSLSSSTLSATLSNVDGKIQIWVASGETIKSKSPYLQLELGSTATPYEEYKGQNITIALGTTVYGGTLNVKTGVLTITHKFKQFDGSENWSNNTNGYVLTRTNGGFADIKIASNADTPIITNMFQNGSTTWTDGKAGVDNGALWVGDASQSTYGGLAEFKAFLSENNLQMAYPLATPTTIQLTGVELALLMGYNRITSDSGDITLTYKANAVQDLQADKADNADIVDFIENGNKASRAYSANQFMLWKGDLYKVTTAIASGATITAGTNVTKTTIGAVLTALLNA